MTKVTLSLFRGTIENMEYLRNKKAVFDYTLEETFECGIELLGTEVKSIRNKHGSLTGSYVAIVDGGLTLLGAHIPAWQEKNVDSMFDPYRTRRLLVHKKELQKIARALQTKGLTLVPISLYNKGKVIKLQVAIARGKKVFNKKEAIKKRDLDRELARGVAL